MKLNPIAGVIAGFAFLWGSALTSPAFAQAQPQTSLAAQILEKFDPARGGMQVELTPAQAQPSEDEIAFLQMLLLQLLMMQQELEREAPVVVPSAATGVAI